MDLTIALAASSAIIVALINNFFSYRQRKKDDISGRLDTIESTQKTTNNKLDLTNRGAMTNLKLQLQSTHEKQYRKVRSANERWSQELDQVFREAYVIYKDLDGNGIVDRLKKDMDIWREKYASEAYVNGKK